jgi:wobble nucleotide-excising tRNase
VLPAARAAVSKDFLSEKSLCRSTARDHRESAIIEAPLLNRLQLFRNVGKFDSVASAAAIALARLTLVYAENGRGKTTLSAILRSLATGDSLPVQERQRLGAAQPPHIVIGCDGGPPPAVFQDGAWSQTVPNMVVFDDTFVDDNICSGLVVEPGHRQHLHDLILGARGVALSRALQQRAEQIEDHNRALRLKSEAIPDAARGPIAVDDFCAFQERADIDDAIREAERNLAAAQDQQTIRATEGFDAVTLPPMDSTTLNALLDKELASLDAAAAEQVQRHLGTLGEGAEAWVAAGMERIPDGTADVREKACPFCAQDLSGSPILAHYRAYFSAAYDDLKEAVAESLDELTRQHGGDNPAAFERAVRRAAERRQYWARFTDLPEVSIDTAVVAARWTAARDAAAEALQAKRNAPLERMQLLPAQAEAIAAYESARQEVIALSDRLQAANASIALVKEQAAASNVTALASDVARLKATKARFAPEIAPLCSAYLAETAAKANAEQQRDTARTALSDYRDSIFPTYETAINEYLRKFGAGFRLARITSQNTRSGSSCNYNVLINNQPIAVSGASAAPGMPSFKNSLSAGDRNTLALAFFFASLDQDAALADKVIIIDDPVSSLDEHRSLTTVQELRRLMQRSGQLIVLSHNKPFLCNLWDGTDPTLRAAIEFARDGEGSTIRSWDVSRDMITEHDRRHALLREYMRAATPNNREVAQALRPVIEAFLRVAYPEHFPPGSLLGPFRNLCLRRVGTPQQILGQADIEELGDLTEYANLFHHDTNPAWQSQHINDAQLLDFVQRTVAFTSR